MSSFSIQKEALLENIGINAPFYFITTICLYILSDTTYSFIISCLSFIIITTLGYFSHIISHNIHFTTLYNKTSVITKHFPFIDKIVRKILRIYDFHHDTHHDSTINRKPENLFYEALNNIFIQGLLFIIVGEIYNYMNKKIFIFWGLLYASFHIINYSIVDSTIHNDHHININTNYGIDIYDILIGTKHNWEDIEDYNHYSINVIIITIIFYVITHSSFNSLLTKLSI